METPGFVSAEPRVRVILGLGANLGDPVRQIREALRMLDTRGVAIEAVSSLYRSEPVGGPEQPEYTNVVVVGSTSLAADAVLAATRAVENVLGRERRVRNAARTIDIDILAFGDAVIRTAELTVPHPRMGSRGFVLHPLMEVAPGWRHPVAGWNARERIAAAGSLERVERVGALDPPGGGPGTG